MDRILERAGSSLLERRMFTKFHGLRDSPTLAAGEPMEGLLVGAARDALAGRGAQVILYGHSQSVQDFACGPGFAQRLRGSLGLPEAQVYGISQINCVSVLRAMELARRYHFRSTARTGERVLVLGGDQGSVADAARIVPRVTVAGDAAAAVVVHTPVGDDLPRYRYLAGGALRDGRFHRSLRMTTKELTLFSQSCVGHLSTALREAAAGAGIRLSDIDWFMPDLSSALFWRNFCRETGIAPERICLDLLPEQGHNNGVDALAALQHADHSGRLHAGDRVALVALGPGAYFQVVIVEVEPAAGPEGNGHR
ncbi:3-oxoacyl-[acyl-carrier-protein] synthase III C-terminal domain-containing protein [Streptomyces cyaneofuscatus]|uniref:3-oxoacyl-ACP synthase n=1 Tax=Streptomyces cyaneofuscatus TaxID=66883 RepID=A0ABZ1EWE2_9ACTN|nr:3-oxoacyl-[acyl-carrier-protein] synthase III C-terminal domain-containing protein [Streptomyces cyaneofuscatus]WSB08284.1 3-oxoacyl-ACP synthase [Streptomyces cyaneofuscatus]WSD48183.1 3-oxoacyl-ACP synthase [Streptomyces cyaneofuscatus]WTA91556.1 3-oxoacyl-ACP synthase [Streptomyces cyaneofuscatus]